MSAQRGVHHLTTRRINRAHAIDMRVEPAALRELDDQILPAGVGREVSHLANQDARGDDWLRRDDPTDAQAQRET